VMVCNSPSSIYIGESYCFHCFPPLLGWDFFQTSKKWSLLYINCTKKCLKDIYAHAYFLSCREIYFCVDRYMGLGCSIIINLIFA
jgi:hypothetical protein